MAKFDDDYFMVEVYIGKKNFFSSPQIIEYVEGEGCDTKNDIVNKALKQVGRSPSNYRAVVELL